MKTLLYVLGFCSLLLTGCDNKDLLQSEDKIREQLENKNWKRVAPSSQDYHEVWTFKEGSVSIIKDNNSNGIIDTIDHDESIRAMYSVDTKFSSSYVTITGIPLDNSLFGYSNLNMNFKWTIAVINNNVLYLSAANETGTIRSLEFVVQ